MRTCLIALALLLCHQQLSAQYWKPLGRGMHRWGGVQINCLLGDTVMDRLLIGGTFLRMLNSEDTLLALGSAAWNGERWDTVAHRINSWNGINVGVQPVSWFIRYGGDLYAAGAFRNYDPIDQRWVHTHARLDTTEQRWKAITDCQLDINNNLNVLGPREPTELMYVTGFPDTLCGPDHGQVFTYDGSTFTKWTPFAEIPYTPGNTYTGLVFTYKGKTYVTGAFQSPFTGQWTSMMRHDGQQWEAIPGWNTLGPIKDVTIDNDTLYICGAFHQSDGAPGNLVAAYDGENWNDLGGGLSFFLPMSAVGRDVLRWKNELYVCGQFDNAGGIAVDRLAKWNGRQWCRLPGNFSNTGNLNEMAVWRDSLYITGAFQTIDGDTVNNIAQWIGGDAVLECSAPVGVAELRASPSFTLHPNPTNGLLHMQLQGLRPRELWVSDALGRVMLRQAMPGAVPGPLPLDLAALSPGAYLVTVLDAEGMRHTQRVVRE